MMLLARHDIVLVGLAFGAFILGAPARLPGDLILQVFAWADQLQALPTEEMGRSHNRLSIVVGEWPSLNASRS